MGFEVFGVEGFSGFFGVSWEFLACLEKTQGSLGKFSSILVNLRFSKVFWGFGDQGFFVSFWAFSAYGFFVNFRQFGQT